MLATYVSATQFTVVGDQTTIFVQNRRVKCDCGVDGFKYGTISTSAYTSLTTVTLTAESDDLTANLTDVQWSVQIPIAVPVHNHTNESTGGDLDSIYEKWGHIDGGIPIDSSHLQDGSILKYDANSGTFFYSETGATLERFVNITGAKNSNSTNTYLNGQDGTAFNQVPFVIPFDCQLLAMSLSSNGAETWTAEVHVDLVLKTGATLSVVAGDSAYANDYLGSGIYFSAGDKIQLYCSGSSVSRPRIDVVLRTY